MFKKIRAAFETRVTVSVTAPDPERFLNDCLRAGLLLQKISRTSPLELTAQMRAAEFRRLPKLVYGKHCRVRIRQKSGIARRVLPYLRRPFFLLGAVGTFLFLHFASGMLWSVSITNNGARDSEILEALAEFGLKPGVKLAELDEGQIKEQVIARLPHLSWVGIFLDGASAEIAIRKSGETIYKKSVDVGIVRLKDACGTDKEKLTAFSKEKIKAYGALPDYGKTYAIGGTATTLAAYKLSLSKYDPEKVTGTTISQKEMSETAEYLLSLPIEKISRLSGIPKGRADVIGGGALFFSVLMKDLGIEEITISDRDNLEGYAIKRGLM